MLFSSSVIPFSSCFQSFPASRSFSMNQFFTWGGQNIGVSVSVLPMNIQDRFLLGLTGLMSLQSKELSRVFNTTVQKHQFFSAQPSWMLNIVKFFFLYLLRCSLSFFQSVFQCCKLYCVNYIDWFSNIEPDLHPWNNPCMVIVV